jgi:polyribonucleotide nucleotidyltransferase
LIQNTPVLHNTNIHSVTVEVGGRPVHFETGKYAKQSHGAVTVRQDDSIVLVTAVSSNQPKPFDFLPLTVEYMDRTAAYGKIPGGFFKREGRANEREILVSRIIDRPIRPLFPKVWRFETQVIATVVSYDPSADTDVLAVCGASAALQVSDIPVSQSAAAVRVVRVDGKFLVNPSQAQLELADLNVVVAGTLDAVCMVEGGGKEVSEAALLDAIDIAHVEIKKICAAIDELRAKVGSPARRPVVKAAEIADDLKAKVKDACLETIQKALRTSGKHERRDALAAAKVAAVAAATEGLADAEAEKQGVLAANVVEKLIRSEMRRMVIEEGVRLDGRATDEIRPIWTEVGIAPRAHGSAVFTRGETQVFVAAALGVEDDAQRLDYAGASNLVRRWMLTYNFPPYCTGESYAMRGPKRREIGHGALAHRALQAVMPPQESFPYVLRCTADVLESNGSSSMGTVCGSTLALLDAGVPLKAPVAGVAMGLIKEGDEYAVLSDILGDEDHLGDMDFKVAGTTAGITAFQMDTKISGVPREVMVRAMAQARDGRLHILGEMANTISAPRPELSPFAPRITTIFIKQDKIRDLIGPGGKVIRGMQEKTGCRITVDDSGRVDVASTDSAAAARCIGMIREITAEAEIGKMYVGVVKRVTDFGAFVEIFPGTEGLVHISQLAKDRVNKVTDVVNEGDEILVRVVDIDKAGKIRLSRKDALDT